MFNPYKDMQFLGSNCKNQKNSCMLGTIIPVHIITIAFFQSMYILGLKDMLKYCFTGTIWIFYIHYNNNEQSKNNTDNSDAPPYQP